MSNRAATMYDFALTAGGSFDLPAEGGAYRIISATGALRIRRGNGSQIGPLYPGQGERQEFERLTLIDMSGAANTGRILVSDDSFIDERITGEVSVVDGGRLSVLGGLCYANLSSLGVVAGNYNCSQLFNPAASTRRVVVEKITVSSSVACLVMVGPNPVQLPSVYGASANTNKYPGGAVGLAELRYENVATANANTSFTMGFYLQANQNFVYEFKKPWVIQPARGLAISNRTIAGDLQSAYDYYEEVI